MCGGCVWRVCEWCVWRVCVKGCERGDLYHSVEGREKHAIIFTIVQRGTCPFPSQQRERETLALQGSVERGRGDGESAKHSCGRRKRWLVSCHRPSWLELTLSV